MVRILKIAEFTLTITMFADSMPRCNPIPIANLECATPNLHKLLADGFNLWDYLLPLFHPLMALKRDSTQTDVKRSHAILSYKSNLIPNTRDCSVMDWFIKHYLNHQLFQNNNLVFRNTCEQGGQTREGSGKLHKILSKIYWTHKSIQFNYQIFLQVPGLLILI